MPVRNLDLCPSMEEAVRLVMATEHIGYAEAVRRLVAIGVRVYRSVLLDGVPITLHAPAPRRR
ncbi:hypothetical protein [Streptoalloteichus hindustanus]|uniref:Uncharacterized protein n=1 Tax=Streptoalloteichus hindustanus TaxID=2017 RepID=A0A1M5DAE7_STRHI|nr:hypothetical protein [Streptoalloteichus hindustanus]SHF63921.1 hypothetical protein SAMN05444320_104366 [Streptoalloteichus hindustanus]